MVAEWGYNLLEALNKYRYDADCETFLHVLRGRMTEDFIKNQEQFIENFENALSDKYPSGNVPTKAALVDFIKEFFPVKSEERMEEVMEALDEQCEGPGPIIFSSLWEENRQGDQVS